MWGVAAHALLACSITVAPSTTHDPAPSGGRGGGGASANGGSLSSSSGGSAQHVGESASGGADASGSGHAEGGSGTGGSAAGATASLGAIPAPWLEQDVGAVGVPGKSLYSGGVFVATGAGLEIYHEVDEFHFTYLPLAGDGEIQARILYVENTATYAPAGVMFRNGLEQDAPAVMVRFAIGQGVFWAARTAEGERWNEPGGLEGQGGSVPLLLRLVRSGNDFTGYYSPDGDQWTQLPPVHMDAAWPVMNVGLAVNSQRNDVTATAVIDGVKVSGGASWQASPPLSSGVDFIPADSQSPDPHCPVSGQPGAGADCARFCDCLAARCAGASDDGQKCLAMCPGFSRATCASECQGFSEADLCCRAGACTEAFHDAQQCGAAFEGTTCAM